MIKSNLCRYQIALGALITLIWQAPAARADLLEASELTGCGALSVAATPLYLASGTAAGASEVGVGASAVGVGASEVGVGASEVTACTTRRIVKLLDKAGQNLDELSQAVIDSGSRDHRVEINIYEQGPKATIQGQNGPKTIPLVIRKDYVELNVRNQPQ